MSEPVSKSLSKSPMAVEVVADSAYKYQPSKEVGALGTLRSLLDGCRGAIEAVMPKHVTPDRLFRTLLTAVNHDPKLLKCTQASIVEGIMKAGELGLDLSGTMGEAYLIPFSNKVDGVWVLQAVLIPGYRGLQKLARQSGEVDRIEARAVYERDNFELEFGLSPKLKLVPAIGDRGKIIGAYALVMLKSGEALIDWMTKAEIDKIRASSKSKDSLMWSEHYGEAARKTVFRRCVKWAPVSAEKFQQALEVADREFSLDVVDGGALLLPEDRPEDERPKADKLADRLTEGRTGVDAPVAKTEGAGASVQAPTVDAQKAPSAMPLLSLEDVDDLRKRAYTAGVSWDQVEESFGGPVKELSGPSVDVIRSRVAIVIDDLAAKSKSR